jgi:hypothetical protein
VGFEPALVSVEKQGTIQRSDANATIQQSRAANVSKDELLMAINTGNQEARLTLAENYEFGRGVPKNLEKAVREYGQVSSLQAFRPPWVSIQASEAIVRIYASGHLKTDSQASDVGIYDPGQLPAPAARFQLAELYWRGNAAVKPDPKRAVLWYLHAARAGSAPAMRRLGELWREGVNGRPDQDEAQRWFRRAAEIEKSGP